METWYEYIRHNNKLRKKNPYLHSGPRKKKMRILRGSILGAASEGKSLSLEEIKQHEARLREQGILGEN